MWSEDTQVMADCLQKLGFAVEVKEDPDEFCNRTIAVEGLGGRIPNAPVSVEFVQVSDSKQGTVYRRFAGIGLTEQVASESMSVERTRFMLGLSPVQLP